MNGKLLLLLSLLGLIMGFVTVYLVPAIVVRLFWLVIFIFCPYFIAKFCIRKYFLNGLLVGLLNAAMITAAHIILFNTYIANHQHETELASNIALLFRIPSGSVMVILIARGAIVGIVSGLLLGLFAFIASRKMKKNNHLPL